jgi:DNA-directed RNA polymerase II subunit RPB1
MNMHAPQNVLAETELRHLAAIPWQMISPSANSPIIGIYQDSLLGSYRFTRPNVKFSHKEAMNLLMMYDKVNPKPFLELRDAKQDITSFDVLSQILSPITLKYKTKLFDEDEDAGTSNNILEIRNGQYIRGQMEKSVLASTTKGIIHRVCNDYGNMQASQFIDDLQNVVTEYMKTSSFSVGISDLIANKTTQDKIIQVIAEKKHDVQTLIEKIHLGIFENNTAQSNMMEFEGKVNNILNDANNQAGSIGRKSLSKTNRFVMIVDSGSKGTPINISQMISCLGQTNVDGKRIPYGFDSRTLPHFSKFDDSPSARGFIENSYISGLTAPELFFHAMGGRIGLIDTAVKTSQTGYIQRRLIKGLEDLKVEYDMTVRNNKGKIIQFAYGDDGFDSTRGENQSVPLVSMTTEDIYLHYDIAGINDEHSNLLNIYSKGTLRAS